MKALTLYQPWASLVAFGEKRIETRSWGTEYRGKLAIHAGKNNNFMIGKHKVTWDVPFKSVMSKIYATAETTPFPLGAIVAICELVDCKKTYDDDFENGHVGWKIQGRYWEASEKERAFGDYSAGRYMWFLKNIQKLAQPIPARGAMGLWEWKEV